MGGTMELRKSVENYKKMQLYSTDNISIKESIIIDLENSLKEYGDRKIGEQEKHDILAKVLSYIEFGFCSKEHKTLLEQILVLCKIDQTELNNMVNKDAQYVKATRANIQKIIIWKNHSSNSGHMKKGEVVEDILYRIKEKMPGEFLYESACCKYKLKIETDMIILKNEVKKIFYYLL